VDADECRGGGGVEGSDAGKALGLSAGHSSGVPPRWLGCGVRRVVVVLPALYGCIVGGASLLIAKGFKASAGSVDETGDTRVDEAR
jgi:hypothetical protein